MRTQFVQRVMARATEALDASGVDRWFAMDYMGSAEFEWGALPRALRGLRAAEIVGPKAIGIRGCTCWFVGPADLLDEAAHFFSDQLGPRNIPLQERTRIADEYSGGRDRYVGWWNVTSAVRAHRSEVPAPGWAIFKTEAHATRWLSALEVSK